MVVLVVLTIDASTICHASTISVCARSAASLVIAHARVHAIEVNFAASLRKHDLSPDNGYTKRLSSRDLVLQYEFFLAILHAETHALRYSFAVCS